MYCLPKNKLSGSLEEIEPVYGAGTKRSADGVVQHDILPYLIGVKLKTVRRRKEKARRSGKRQEHEPRIETFWQVHGI
jgi:hypothetical protein